MRICYSIISFVFISTFGFSQTPEKKILFQGDSIWYAAQENVLFSSTSKGEKWDTIFSKNKQMGNVFYTIDFDTAKNVFNPYNRTILISDTVFFYGVFDTASNVFISDQHTLFVFGWDGTMHYKTILYSSNDCGKTWDKSSFQSQSGIVGVKYFHEISPTQFFLDCRYGYYAVSVNQGKNWYRDKLVFDGDCCENCKKDERFTFSENGEISYQYFEQIKDEKPAIMISHDGGLTFTGRVEPVGKKENHK